MNGGMHFKRLLEMIFRALEDERAAAMFYNQMVAMAPDFNTKEACLLAWHDERHHVAEIAELIKELTGVEAPNTMAHVPCPSNFTEGLRMALEGEEMAISEYANIINMAGIERIRHLFREIRDDEMVHAEKFRTLMQLMQGTNGNGHENENGNGNGNGNHAMPTQSPMG